MSPNKACPVILSNTSVPRILLFRHPLAGVQLVKGTIEAGETPAQTALRELREESGIDAATAVCDMGYWIAGHLDQVWSFQLCEAQIPLPEQWTHYTFDDHGHAFSFFWAPLDDLPFAHCHPVFHRALLYVKTALSKGGYLMAKDQHLSRLSPT
ncbi:NUDIX domain-containing protein [Pseudomonas sp. JV414]|uniref:NUDIX hydrolase n=1 Tax=Pseudomonas TaxID=286 RepID=UPI000681194D|nr:MULTISPECIES: NUDIX domain-containing protein [Pseudomonas]KNH44466.1 DNA mismatch repair protein MutT [Pseudomonas lini]MDT9678530.1 NUDIX domain-containing protein [Pseudomonas sp. JV414]